MGKPGSMRLYKFVAAERVADLLDGWVRFTQPGAFNDPFEIPAMKVAEIEERPSDFLAAATQQTRDIQAGFAQNPLQVPAAALRLPMNYWGSGERDPELSDTERARLLEAAKAKIRDIDTTYGILSLSRTREEFLLWAHYADEHRGAVFEIDIAAAEFNETYPTSEENQRCDMITYVEERPLLPVDNDILMKHFFSKSPHWAYEQEYRIVRKLAHSDRTIETGRDYDIHLFRLAPECLASLTFGTRFERDARTDLARRIQDAADLRHVRLEQARLDTRRFALAFEPLPPSNA